MTKKTYEQVIEEAKSNAKILGLILVGSRGKGFGNEYSDYDLVMVVNDESVDSLKLEYKHEGLQNMDLSVYSWSEFKNYANWDSSEYWKRYDFAHVKILVDKIGELQEIVEEKGYIPKDRLRQFIASALDGYVNGVFRSVKCMRNKNEFGAQIEAVNSMLDLLTSVFALNGRHRPFLGYIEKELLAYPLEHLPWEPGEFIEKVSTVMKTANIGVQQELLKGMEKMSRDMGYGQVFDLWEGKDKWTMEFKLET